MAGSFEILLVATVVRRNCYLATAEATSRVDPGLAIS